MKTVAEKIVDALEQFADDLEQGRPIECRTMDILKRRKEQNGRDANPTGRKPK